MRAILISIKPEWVAKILNGKKTLEIRKTAPKCELPIEVYIYETKDQTPLAFATNYPIELAEKVCDSRGKVVAKFTLMEITEYITGCNVTKDSGYMFGDAEREGVYEKACFSEEDIERYFPDESFMAWNISDLEIFDEPKELDEFKCWKEYPSCKKCPHAENENDIAVCENRCRELLTVKRAPQSWQYVEEKK